MIGFVIPLKPKSQSKNWEKDCAMLNNTLASLLNQTNEHFKVFVVYTDAPDLNIQSSKLHFIQFPFPFIPFDSIPEAQEILPHFSFDKLMLERRWDKSKKIFYGCKIAKEQGCNYLMSVDADDLLSNKLVEFVESRQTTNHVPGFYISKGYLLNYGKKRMIKINEGMQNFNGSTHILSSEFVVIPDFEKGKWMDFNLFTSHGWVLHRLKEQYNIQLESIPFPAVVYVAHGGNISKVSMQKFTGKIKQLIKSFIRGQYINSAIKKEFAVYPA